MTGASRGIGAATALALANSGVSRLILHYNSYKPGIEKVMASAQKAGAQAQAIQADLGADAGVQAFIASLAATGAGVDILINNAGSLVKRAKLAEFSSDLFDRVMTLNVKSAWFIAQAVTPHMLAAKSGVIVNVSSMDNDFHVQFSTRQILDSVVAATPAGTLGTNEEIADTILFLCSQRARFIHGQTIEINGGMFMV